MSGRHVFHSGFGYSPKRVSFAPEHTNHRSSKQVHHSKAPLPESERAVVKTPSSRASVPEPRTADVKVRKFIHSDPKSGKIVIEEPGYEDSGPKKRVNIEVPDPEAFGVDPENFVVTVTSDPQSKKTVINISSPKPSGSEPESVVVNGRNSKALVTKQKGEVVDLPQRHGNHKNSKRSEPSDSALLSTKGPPSAPYDARIPQSNSSRGKTSNPRAQDPEPPRCLASANPSSSITHSTDRGRRIVQTGEIPSSIDRGRSLDPDDSISVAPSPSPSPSRRRHKHEDDRMRQSRSRQGYSK